MIREKPAFTAPGLLTLLFLVILALVSIAALVALIIGRAPALAIVASILENSVVLVCFFGFIVVNPNEAQVLQIFGNYMGSANQAGFWWTNPFAFPRRKVSRRIRNFESARLKVNDHDGNPIEIARWWCGR
jgi:regulator of protease activity HflC (stomatin/prohibitin superfamily)